MDASLIRRIEDRAFEPVTEIAVADFSCSHCGHDKFDEDEGYIFCGLCGLTSRLTSLTANLEFMQSPSGKYSVDRCGYVVNPLLPNTGMSTRIISGKDERIRRLHVWTSCNNKDHAKLHMFSLIQTWAARGNLNTAIVRQTEWFAAQVCDRMTATSHIFRGRHRHGLIAACFYFAFKKKHCPRSCTEVALLLGVEISCVTQGINNFADMFQRRLVIADDRAIRAKELIPRYCNKLCLPIGVENLVRIIVDHPDAIRVLAKHVVEARLAGCIWFVVKAIEGTKLPLPMRDTAKGSTAEQTGRWKEAAPARRDISEVSGISEITISKCCRALEDCIALVPPTPST